MNNDLRMAGFERVMRGVEEAREAILVQHERTTLALGDYIAWSDCDRGGCTDALSSLHRVGEPKKGNPYTTCGVPIPAPVRWLSLGPQLVEGGLMPCGFCAAFPGGIVVRVA